jgi:hypothetical protein
MAGQPRKTTEVHKLVKKANRLLALPESDERPYANAAFRQGVFTMLEAALWESNQYAGFSYQASEFDNNYNMLKRDHDDTRRVYFIKKGEYR